MTKHAAATLCLRRCDDHSRGAGAPRRLCQHRGAAPRPRRRATAGNRRAPGAWCGTRSVDPSAPDRKSPPRPGRRDRRHRPRALAGWIDQRPARATARIHRARPRARSAHARLHARRIAHHLSAVRPRAGTARNAHERASGTERGRPAAPPSAAAALAGRRPGRLVVRTPALGWSLRTEPLECPPHRSWIRAGRRSARAPSARRRGDQVWCERRAPARPAVEDRCDSWRRESGPRENRPARTHGPRRDEDADRDGLARPPWPVGPGEPREPRVVPHRADSAAGGTRLHRGRPARITACDRS